MVANRLVDPKSKLAVSSWYKEKVYLPELENTNFAPHEFYRSMDYLEKMKGDIEKDLDYIKEQDFSYIVTLRKRRLNEAREAIEATFADLEEKKNKNEKEKKKELSFSLIHLVYPVKTSF